MQPTTLGNQALPEGPPEVPFEFFAELVEAIGAIRPKTSTARKPTNASPSSTPAVRVLEQWRSEMSRRYFGGNTSVPSATDATIFRLLFPEKDSARRYGMQETRLARYLAKIYGVSTEEGGRGRGLRDWCAEGQEKRGCLGMEIEKVAVDTNSRSGTSGTTSLTIAEVDELLTELAATCPFSSPSVRQEVAQCGGTAAQVLSTPRATPRKAFHILQEMFAHPALSPAGSAVLVQVILKDLRPLLYPIPQDAMHFTTALTGYKSNAFTELTIEQALRVWDTSGALGRLWKMQGWAAFLPAKSNTTNAPSAVPGDGIDDEDPEARADTSPLYGTRTVTPIIGQPVGIPKCVKGTSCVQAMRSISRNTSCDTGPIWAETKYDGERAQIHVELIPGSEASETSSRWKVTIWSKSGRDSTWDRAGIHSIIEDALGLSDNASDGAQAVKVQRNAIVEAEMVAYSDTLGRIDEFWRIRSLIASTAIGPRHRGPRRTKPISPVKGTQESTQDMDTDDGARSWSQLSLASNASDGGTRRLALVFFDVLMLDNVPLVDEPYRTRRGMLEQIVRTKTGHAMLAERTCIGDSETALQRALSSCMAAYEEGLVLKAEESNYNDWRMPWVKLKKDYIPGYGDCVDLVLLGAGWHKDRARELRVPPTVYTTFYIGSVARDDTASDKSGQRPHFQILFTAEYGLSRDALEELNFIVKNSDHVECRNSAHPLSTLPYTYDMYSGITHPGPAILVEIPLAVEVMGAGFTKEPHSKYYTLRFPRMLKVHRRSERSWRSTVFLKEFQSIARSSVGKDRPGKAEDDWCKQLWGGVPSPGVRAQERTREREELWAERLEQTEERIGRGKRKRDPRSEDKAKGARPRQREQNRDRPRTELDRAKTIDTTESRARGGDAPKTPTSVRVFESVTNLALPTPSSPLAHKARMEITMLPLMTPRSSNHVPLPDVEKPARVPSTPSHRRHTEASLPRPSSTERTAQALSPRALTPAMPEAAHVPLVHTPTPRYADTPLGQFLARSAIWIPPSFSPPTSVPGCTRVELRDIVPATNRVFSLDALLLACRWPSLSSAGPESTWAERGIVFVEDDNLSMSVPMNAARADSTCLCRWTQDNPLGRLIARRSAMLGSTPEGGEPVPIWVFSASVLSVEWLEGEHNVNRHTASSTTQEEDLAARAILRIG